MTRRRWSKPGQNGQDESPGIVELFGGLIAVLLIILIFISIQRLEFVIRARIDPAGIGDYKVHWDNKDFDGIVIVLSGGRMTVLENGLELAEGDLCINAMRTYIRKTYSENNRIFLLYITEGGIGLFRELRDCIFEVLPSDLNPQIYFLMADKQVLKMQPHEKLDPQIYYYLEQNRTRKNEAADQP